MTMLEEMTKFEGRVVASATVKITRAGDGLSEAMALDPTELHHGEEVWIVLKGTVSRVSYDPIKKADGLLSRVHTVQADEVAIVAPDEVEHLLARERDRVLRLREERGGVSRLPLGDDPLGLDDDGEISSPGGTDEAER